MKENYITIKDAAELLDVKKRTVYNYIKDGTLPLYKIKKQSILYIEDVEKLLIPVRVK